MKHDSIIQNLQRLGLLLAVWLCAACASTARPEVAAPLRASCSAEPAGASELLAGCEEVVGDLRIEHSDFSNLSHLAALRSVSGTLFLGGNAKLESLEGLEQLEQVGEVVIVNNPKLSNVSGLSKLELVQRISIAHNRALEQLDGFNAIKHVDNLTIMHNGLTRVKGFGRLESAGQVTIAQNARLIYLSGLEHLTFVEDLALEYNPRLAPSASLLSSLVHVDGKLSVEGCPGVSQAKLSSTALAKRLETASR